MSKFSPVLKNRNFLLLWIGQIISQFGDRLDQMVLIGLIYKLAPGSTIQMAKILTCSILPVFIVGPLAGAYVDRWDRRKTMYVCDFFRAILILSIPLVFLKYQSIIPIYIVIFLSFSLGRFFIPAKLAIIPELVDKKNLLLANSLVNTTGMIAAIFGYGLGGFLVEWLGPKGGFTIDGLTFLISSGLVFFIKSKTNNKAFAIGDIRKMSRDVIERLRKSVLSEIKEGMLYLLRKKEVKFTIEVFSLLSSCLGALYVVSIVFVQNIFQSGTKDIGVLIVFLGLGLLVGSLFYGRFGERVNELNVIFLALALCGLSLVGFAVSLHIFASFFLAAFISFITGIFAAPIVIGCNTIVHKSAENHMFGKVFSSLEIIMHIGFLVFMLVSSIVAEFVPRFYIIILVGLILISIGSLNFIKRYGKAQRI